MRARGVGGVGEVGVAVGGRWTLGRCRYISKQASPSSLSEASALACSIADFHSALSIARGQVAFCGARRSPIEERDDPRRQGVASEAHAREHAVLAASLNTRR